MSPNTNRRCGTCRWFRPSQESETAASLDLGTCRWERKNRPFWLKNTAYVSGDTDGLDCEAWADGDSCVPEDANAYHEI